MTGSKTFFAALIFLFLADTAMSGIYRTCRLSIINSAGTRVYARVEIADTLQKRNHGLMFRQSLDKNSGMLFIFFGTRHRSFWMKNTLIPLTIAYIDEKGIITQLIKMRPLDASVTYESEKPAKYALEMKQGWFRKHKIRKGSRVLLNGCIGQ